MNNLVIFNAGVDEPSSNDLYGVLARSELAMNLLWGPMLAEVRRRGMRAAMGQN
jgi:hypothetical protein